MSNLETLKEALKANNKLYSERALLYLIILKYKCDQGEYNIEDIINSFIVDDLSYLIRNTRDTAGINKCLANVKDLNPKEALLELLSDIKNRSKIKIPNNSIIANINDNDINYYDPTGNSAYVEKAYSIERNELKTFNLMDEILEIHNTYLSIEDIYKKNNYDYLYIPSLSFSFDYNYKLNILDIINDNINNYKEIVLIPRANKVLNFTKGKNLIKYLNKIIFKYNAELHFINKKENNNINIIVYHYPNLLLNKEEPEKEEFIITEEEVKENHYRLGYQIYKLSKSPRNSTSVIQEENERYISQVERLNELIKEDLEKLFNNK